MLGFCGRNQHIQYRLTWKIEHFRAGIGVRQVTRIQTERTTHYRQLRDRLITGVLTHIPQAHLTGHPEQRLPTHASFVFDGLDNGQLVDYLDQRGIAASAASTCKTGSPEPSGVKPDKSGWFPGQLAVSSRL
jgi:selenocysteine lyase/cysteine desulfurase